MHSARQNFLKAVFVNLLEPHLPYDPPDDYRRRVLPDLPPDDTVPIRWGHEFNAGLFVRLLISRRPFRTSWLIVGTLAHS